MGKEKRELKALIWVGNLDQVGNTSTHCIGKSLPEILCGSEKSFRTSASPLVFCKSLASMQLEVLRRELKGFHR